jgi:aquaporin Z
LLRALRAHWPEYAMEAAGLGLFMLSAGILATALEHPGSLFRDALPDPVLRRVLMGVGIGLTAIALINSPWGKRSGAHLNPAVTLTFLRLGKVERWDALFYIASQTVGGTAGVLLVAALVRGPFTTEPVLYVVTRPGHAGSMAAFAGEFAISFALMTMVLWASNSARLSRHVGILAGLLLAAYITFEAPLSGMSINPARTLASALPAGVWTAFWLYLTAPILGMQLAAQLYLTVRGRREVYCAKFNHHSRQRCIFRCRFAQLEQRSSQ